MYGKQPRSSGKIQCMLLFEVFVAAAHLFVDTHFLFGPCFSFKILDIVRTVRERPGGKDKSTDLILLVLLIYNLIIYDETTSAESR